jgi:hypothetical protein
MFDSETIKQFKQINISADAEKTTARMAELWKRAPAPQRQEAVELAGVTVETMRRTYKTGNISAKLVVPIAKILNVDPFFITGESDNKGECTDELLRKLIEKHGSSKSAKAVKHGRRKKQPAAAKQARVTDIPASEAESHAPQPSLAELAQSAESQKHAENVFSSENTDVYVSSDPALIDLAATLTEENIAILLKALLLRAKAGGKYAEIAGKIKMLLLL